MEREKEEKILTKQNFTSNKNAERQKAGRGRHAARLQTEHSAITQQQGRQLASTTIQSSTSGKPSSQRTGGTKTTARND